MTNILHKYAQHYNDWVRLVERWVQVWLVCVCVYPNHRVHISCFYRSLRGFRYYLFLVPFSFCVRLDKETNQVKLTMEYNCCWWFYKKIENYVHREKKLRLATGFENTRLCWRKNIDKNRLRTDILLKEKKPTQTSMSSFLLILRKL